MYFIMNSRSSRCQCYTQSNHKCKLKFCFMLENKKYCHIHAKKHYNIKVILIQSFYRGFSIRKKLNTLFKPLPRDIQLIVLNYIKEPYYINKYNKSISKILNNKVEKTKHERITNQSLCIYKKYYEDYINLYKLYSKYSSITHYYYDNILSKLINEVWNIFIRQIRECRILDTNGENIVLTNNWSELHKTLYNTLTNYQNIYNQKYNDKYPPFYLPHYLDF